MLCEYIRRPLWGRCSEPPRPARLPWPGAHSAALAYSGKQRAYHRDRQLDIHVPGSLVHWQLDLASPRPGKKWGPNALSIDKHSDWPTPAQSVTPSALRAFETPPRATLVIINNITRLLSFCVYRKRTIRKWKYGRPFMRIKENGNTQNLLRKTEIQESFNAPFRHSRGTPTSLRMGSNTLI